DPVQGAGALGEAQLLKLDWAGGERSEAGERRPRLDGCGEGHRLGQKKQAQRRGAVAVQRDLGVVPLAVSPGCAQALEGGAVFESRFGEEVIEVLDLKRLGSLGGPGVQ